MGIIGGDRKAYLASVEMDSGRVVAELLLATGAIDSTTLSTFVYNDDINVYCQWQDSGSVLAGRFVPSGSTFVKTDQQASGIALDAFFDGQYVWVLFASTVNQYLPRGIDVILVKSWNHGLTGVRGITSDGNLLIITTT